MRLARMSAAACRLMPQLTRAAAPSRTTHRDVRLLHSTNHWELYRVRTHQCTSENATKAT